MDEIVSCNYCDTPAPHDGDEAVYLVLDEANKALVPSCPGHATHGRDGLLIDWRLRAPAKPARNVRVGTAGE